MGGPLCVLVHICVLTRGVAQGDGGSVGGGGFVEVESSRRETFPSGGTRSKRATCTPIKAH